MGNLYRSGYMANSSPPVQAESRQGAQRLWLRGGSPPLATPPRHPFRGNITGGGGGRAALTEGPAVTPAGSGFQFFRFCLLLASGPGMSPLVSASSAETPV